MTFIIVFKARHYRYKCIFIYLFLIIVNYQNSYVINFVLVDL